MARAEVPKARVADGTLPAVCVVCGAKAVERRFPGVSSPSLAWVVVSPLFGLLAFWVYVLVGGGQATDQPRGFPFCERHRKDWTRRAWFIVGGFLALVFLMVIGFLLTPKPAPGHKAEPHWIFGVAGLWMLIYLPAFLIVHLRAVRPTSATRDAIVLSGVSREFASAVAAKGSLD
jgi:hypothetical protein